MAVDYAKLAATATRLISENGRTVTFKRVSRTVADPSKPWKGTNPSADVLVPVKAVLVPYTEEEMPDEQMRRGAMKCFVAASAFGTANDHSDMEFLTDPETGVWRVLEVKTVFPGEVKVLYEVALRR